MHYEMKQHWLSFSDTFTIRDEAGRDALMVKGRVFSWGDKLSLQDMSGQELAYVDQQMLSWGPTYRISRGGQEMAIVKKHLFSLFKTRFSVDVPGPDDLEAEGDFLGHDYRFIRNGQVVGTVSRAWFSLTDSYGIEVAPGTDDLLILASAVVIDMVTHDGKDKKE